MNLDIVPDRQDMDAVDQQHGRPHTPREAIEHYRFAQARKLVRLYEHGRLPLVLMRQLDEIRANAYLRNVCGRMVGPDHWAV
jgi:hypothetical protein